MSFRLKEASFTQKAQFLSMLQDKYYTMVKQYYIQIKHDFSWRKATELITSNMQPRERFKPQMPLYGSLINWLFISYFACQGEMWDDLDVLKYVTDHDSARLYYL